MHPVLAGHLDAVVVLGVEFSQEARRHGAPETQDSGTAFFYVYPDQESPSDNPADLWAWLVTCQHVVKNIDRLPGEMFVRFNKVDQPDTSEFPLRGLSDPENTWTIHPKEDIAVMPISLTALISRGLECSPFLTGEALARDRLTDNRVGEGDDVYLIGFPEGKIEGHRDRPVVRQGILAQVQGWLHEEHDHFLVDGSSFGGNSGGPVVTRPRSDLSEDHILSHSLLLGMVQASALSHGTSEGGENADLVHVIPVDAINDTIERALQQGQIYSADD